MDVFQNNDFFSVNSPIKKNRKSNGHTNGRNKYEQFSCFHSPPMYNVNRYFGIHTYNKNNEK